MLDVFVSKAGLRLVKNDGKVLGAFPLQRIQQWGIPSPGTFKLSVQNGDKVVGLVIHGEADEVTAIMTSPVDGVAVGAGCSMLFPCCGGFRPRDPTSCVTLA